MKTGTVRSRVFTVSVVANIILVLVVAYLLATRPPGLRFQVVEASPSGSLAVGDGGANRGLTQSDLETATAGHPGFRLLLPTELPTGQSPLRPFLETFYWSGSGLEQSWVTEYAAYALPPLTGNVSGYTVYQDTGSQPVRKCGTSEVVSRIVEGRRLSICLGQSPTDKAREFWSSVPFSSDLSEVTWLPK